MIARKPKADSRLDAEIRVGEASPGETIVLRMYGPLGQHADSVVAPLLLLRSATDHVVEPVNGRILLAGVSSAVAEERILPDSYHVATLDNDAETIFLESLAFVRRFTRAAPD